MTTISFIEVLEKLPFNRRREVFNFLEFIYQKTLEEDLSGLTKEDIAGLKERRHIFMNKPDTSSSIEEAKRKLKGKYGL